MSTWVLPGFTEVRQLGRGASGRVVAAVDEASGRPVAIKYLAPKLFRSPEFLAGFRAEAELLRSLDVPQVVRLFDYVEESGQGAAIVMELVDGVSLHELISQHGATSPEAALVVLKGSLLGLAAAHALGIVHRDYKPENVLVDAEGNSKLADFGVAVKEGRRAPAAGTPLYMAPEQWEGAAASPATDIYAAAAVFFECLTSKTPFSGRLGQLQQQHLSAAVPLEQVDEPLRGLIARGMAKSPADRPANATAFVTELDSTAAAAYGPDWEERGRSQLRERAAALLLLLLGAGGGGTGGAVAGIWLSANRNAVRAGAAAAAVLVVAITATAVALSGGGTPGPKPSVTIRPIAVRSEATVTATPSIASSACARPTTFAFSANLGATAAGSVSYRWAYSTGKKGPVQTLHFPAPGTQLVSGGSVQAEKAGTGWAAIEVGSPLRALSNKAVYRLICTTPGTVTVSATVTPATRTVACGTAPPRFTFTGLIRSPKSGRVTYHWTLSDGATSPPATLRFARAGVRAVRSLTVTPPGDTADGAAVLVVTSPGTRTSNTASYALTCPTVVTSLPQPPAPAQPPVPALSAAAHASPAADSVNCATAPPTVTFSGTITASKATTVSYYWKLPSGNTATQTLTFGAPGAKPVSSVPYAPATTPASGSGMIVITSPTAATSAAAPFSFTCAKKSSAPSPTYPPVTITTSGDLPPGTVGTPYEGASVSAAGGRPPYTWRASGLPSGLGMSTSGSISGTPATAGTFAVVVTARDSQSPARTASGQLTLIVNPRLSITVASLTSAPTSPLSQQCGDGYPAFTVQGTLTSTVSTTATYHWRRSDGSNTAATRVSVSPQASTTVTDEVAPTSANWTGTDTLEVTSPTTAARSIDLAYSCSAPDLVIVTESLPPGQDGVPYSATVSASGGDGRYAWSASGLPAGLSIAPGSGTISGTPDTSGAFSVTITVTDGESPPQTKSATLPLTIDPPSDAPSGGSPP